MFTKRITQMPEEELLKAFEELLHLETTGLLGEGYIRQLEREYDYTIQNIRVGILKEMSLRYYNNISKIRKDRRQLDCDGCPIYTDWCERCPINKIRRSKTK